jgi:uncharacterized protein YbcI
MPDSTVSTPDGVIDARGATAARISTGAVQLLNEYTGRGPTKAQTIINSESVAIVLQDTLTKGERQLVKAGLEDDVLNTRHAYQGVMKQDLIALVETNVQRKVVAFLSANHAEPDVAVEFFLLESQASDDGASATA